MSIIKGRQTIGTVGFMSGVPSVLTRFWWSSIQFVEFNARYLCDPNEEVYYVKTDTSFHATARNRICEQALGNWLFMLDTDHAFEPDLLYRLLVKMERYNLDVLSALYRTRIGPPYNPVAYFWDGDDSYQQVKYFEGEPGIVKVDALGAGNLLIRRRALDKIISISEGNPFGILPDMGEDFSFCKRCKEAGVLIHLDTTIEVEHLTVAGAHEAAHQVADH